MYVGHPIVSVESNVMRSCRLRIYKIVNTMAMITRSPMATLTMMVWEFISFKLNRNFAFDPSKMAVQVVLNRSLIAGSITENTPSCVICQIAKSQGFDVPTSTEDAVYLNKVIESLPKRKCRTVPRTGFDRDQATYVCRFVNGDLNFRWTSGQLIEAFEHLIQYYQTETPPLPPEDFVVGYKTPTALNAYDPCMLYRICTWARIRTSRSMTLEQLGMAVRLLLQNPEEIRVQVADLVRHLPMNQLLSLRMSPEFALVSSPRVQIDEARRDTIMAFHEPSRDVMPEILRSELACVFTRDALSTIHTKLTDMRHLLNRIIPTTHQEAAILAAIVYGVNLTECVNPYAEYIEMRRLAAISSGTSYLPVSDPVFRHKYVTNPFWYDVRRKWTPYLPIYNREDMRRFALSEGFIEADHRRGHGFESFLHLMKVTQTFHIGIPPSMITSSEIPSLQTQISFENPFTYGCERIIAYGVEDDPDHLQLYTVEELVGYFRSGMKFTNPFKPTEVIPSSAITKLKNICQDFLGMRSGASLIETLTHRSTIPITSDITVIRQDYQNLHDVICQIELRLENVGRQAQELQALHTTHSAEIEASLHLLKEVGFYMRGWKLPKAYVPGREDVLPLESADTVVDSEVQGQIMVNVTDAIQRFEARLDTLPYQVRIPMMTLPLMMKCATTVSFTFVATTDHDQGLTIMDRIRICKDGSSIHACIRSSSNHFLSSAYYYLTVVLGQPPPFPIELMAQIS